MNSQFRIGTVTIPNRLALGPMAGVTDMPFRLLCKEQGAGLLFTEMISAKAVCYRNKGTALLAKTAPEEHPAALQLFGSEPEIVAEGGAMLDDDSFDLFDLNMGCPVPKVVKNGEGSALMLEPERAADIVDALVRRVRKPVTVKIRKGFDEDHINAPELAKRLEAAGASAISVHARTREQYYSGKADWSIIRSVKEAVSIPVIGNGDVTGPDSAERMIRETGCDAVMIARAARGNPWIFREILCPEGPLKGRPSPEEKRDVMLRHLEMTVALKGEYIGIREMRGHLACYAKGMRGAAEYRRLFNQADSAGELERLICRLTDYYSEG